MFEDTYKTAGSPSEGLYKEKGSRFIAKLFPINNEQEAKTIIADLKKEYYDARHHCYAYTLTPNKSIFRINDDGEPSGTGGKPIYGQLLSHDLTNILIVVIRYFGGVKLGVSGLINAYKTAAKNAIELSNIIEKTVDEIYQIRFPYLSINEVMKILKENNIEQSEQNFDIDCSLKFKVRTSQKNKVCDAMMKIEGLNLTYIDTQ